MDIRNKKTSKMVTVPCGKCLTCKKRHVSAWSFRLVQEGKVSRSAHFLTLTYDTQNVPRTKANFKTLVKRDLQLFFKRLRKAHGVHAVGLKYYAVGEYGTNSWRPHYHVILFNASLDVLIGKLDATQVRQKNLVLDGKTPFQCASWYAGHITIGKVTGASIGYTLKYITKDKRVPLHKNDDRCPEFSLMSKGLGATYLNPKMIKWHMADMENRMYVNVEGDKKAAMPRYYKNMLYSDVQREQVASVTLKKLKERFYKEKAQAGKTFYRNRSESHFALTRKSEFEQSKKSKL